MMSLIALKSEYIICANQVYYNLLEAQEIYRLEANVLNYAKCFLANNEYLKSFETQGYNVIVYDNGKGYDLYVDGYCISLVTYEKQILSFNIKNSY